MVTLFRPAAGKGNWYAKWTVNGHERRKSLRTRDKKLAAKIRDEMEKALIGQEYGVLDDIDYTPEDAWAEYQKLVRKKAHTLTLERTFWFQFFAFCKAPTLRAVRRSDVPAWQKALLASGNAVTTVNDKLRQVGTVWNWLVKEEVFSGANPFAGRRRLDEGPRKVRVIEWAKVQNLLEIARQDMYDRAAAWVAAQNAGEPYVRLQAATETARGLYLSLVLAAYSGLRKAEALALCWEDFDWAENTIAVRGTKTAASTAKLHLHQTLREALEPYAHGSGYVVKPDKSTGANRYRFELKKEWQRLREKAGLPDARLHDLRHSFATRLLDLGYSLKDIAVMLRHSSTRPTEIYADLRTVKVQIGAL